MFSVFLGFDMVAEHLFCSCHVCMSFLDLAAPDMYILGALYIYIYIYFDRLACLDILFLLLDPPAKLCNPQGARSGDAR